VRDWVLNKKLSASTEIFSPSRFAGIQADAPKRTAAIS
jgi:hypothetical protein